MPTFSFHDVGQEVYDALDVRELHGPTKIWKQLWVKDCELVFHPGDWRYPPPDRPEEPDGVIAF